MTFRIGPMVVIVDEAPRACQLCSKVAQCRPYGPGGKDICWECGQLPENREEMQRRMTMAITGGETH